MPPVMLATVVPCRLPPASTRIESGVLAFSAATSARLTLSLARWPAREPVANTGTVMSPTRTRHWMLSVPSASVAVMVHSPLSAFARTRPCLSTVATLLSLVVQKIFCPPFSSSGWLVVRFA